MLIKKDNNEELEKIITQKDMNEQAKNLLQGILYKIDISYKDYKIAKVKKQTKEKYIQELLMGIEKKCNTIKVIGLKQKLVDENIQKQLEKNKIYVDEEIVTYPIEEKMLYAIEKKINKNKILNNKYGETTTAISYFINEGKILDRVEVLRDFNGWSWSTINKEIENIEANLIYQIIQINLGEDFLNNWSEDKDGIIDYLEQFMEEETQKNGKEIAEKQKNLLISIAMANTAKHNQDFLEDITNKIENINKFDNPKKKIEEVLEENKNILKQLNNIEIILKQKNRLKEEFEKRIEEEPIDKKIFNIKIFEKQLIEQKKDLISKIEKNNEILNPNKFLKEKEKLQERKQYLQLAIQSSKEVEELIIKFIENFLICFKNTINQTKDEEELIKLIYKFRYFKLLPVNTKSKIKDIKKIENKIIEVEKLLIEKAVKQKVISDVPFEVMRHVLCSRIIKLEDLYYKISVKDEKYYAQIFDGNISQEEFEIETTEKIKKRRRTKIFIL